MYEFLLADTGALAPIWIVALAGVAVVVLDCFYNDSPMLPLIAGGALALALGIEVLRVDEIGTTFGGHLRWGGAAAFANGIVLLAGLASVGLADGYLKKTGHNYGEIYAMLLFATTGMLTLASAGSMIAVFVGLETMSVCLYALTGLTRTRPAIESALKYYLLGAFASGFLLYGIALLYGATGTMMLTKMPAGLLASNREMLFLGGVALLLVGFLFKVSAVPFHMWTPDVYQGAPTPLVGFMSTASKTAAFAALIAVLSSVAGFYVEAQWQPALAVIALLTMVVGNGAALVQTNAKRMLAYSSVAHAGYVLTGLAAANAMGYAGALYYLLAYTLMNLGAFGVLALLEEDEAQGAEATMASLAGAAYRRPLLGVLLALFMFGLTGFPPLAGFVGKFQVFAAAVQADMQGLAVIGVLASAASAVYYLRLAAVVWKRPHAATSAATSGSSMPVAEPAPIAGSAAPAQPPRFAVPVVAVVVLVGCAVLLVGLGVVPTPVLEPAQSLFNGISTIAGH